MSGPLEGVRAIVFDAYGTLLDVASAAERARGELGDRWPALAETWRAKQLQYAWIRTLTGRHADFWRVTGDALDFSLEQAGLEDRTLRERLMSLYERLSAHPDARPALEALRPLKLKLAVLSNGTPRMLASAAESAGLAPYLDALLSVEEVGAYKPASAVYRLAAHRLGVWPSEIAYVSANGWDAFGAKAFGLRVVWCNRSGQPPERLPEAPDLEIHSLSELLPLLGVP